MKLQHVDSDIAIKLELINRKYIVTSRVTDDPRNGNWQRFEFAKNELPKALKMYLHLITCEATCYASSDAEREAILQLVK